MTVTHLNAYAAEVVDAVAPAVRAAQIPPTVMLSSGGADLPESTGPLRRLRRMEKALKTAGTTLTALCLGHFQEKFTDVLDAARHEGSFPFPRPRPTPRSRWFPRPASPRSPSASR